MKHKKKIIFSQINDMLPNIFLKFLKRKEKI